MPQREFEPVKLSRVYDRIVNQVIAMIQDGTLKPGDRLPSERALSEMVGVSRPTLRIALRVLEGMGLIHAQPGSGTYVSELDTDTLVGRLSVILAQKKLLLEEMLDVREILEPPVAQYAAKRATDEDIDQLKQILERQYAKLAKNENAAEEDGQFHYALAVAAKNGLLMPVIELLMRMMKEAREVWLSGKARGLVSVRDHERILTAVANRDESAACDAMVSHIQRVREVNIGSEKET